MVVTTFIFASCIGLALETVGDYSTRYKLGFLILENLSVIVFSIDYFGHLWVSEHRWAYVFSFWGLVDVISIAPSYLLLLNVAAIKGTKVLRLLRVARVLRVLKLSRTTVDQLQGDSGKPRNPIASNLRIYLIILFSVLMISSTAMYFIEGGLYSNEAMESGQAALNLSTAAGQQPAIFVPQDPISGVQITEDKRFFTSIPSAMWWAVVTLTTTGYGDMYPVTLGGRLIAVFTMFSGLILFGLLMDIVRNTMMALFFGEQVLAANEAKGDK
jgi:voltage-gated potassium channel